MYVHIKQLEISIRFRPQNCISLLDIVDGEGVGAVGIVDSDTSRTTRRQEPEARSQKPGAATGCTDSKRSRGALAGTESGQPALAPRGLAVILYLYYIICQWAQGDIEFEFGVRTL